ncbi:sensor histidine kinase [Mediterraneibacter sp.]|jgi:signal transduction histidine kinase|uniref:sensor histidine kinase n=1 Tax=Mediterraneibacter sp. TaxID=2316022 RepID=UPI0027B9A9F6|nr:HAMP domain-containing sensor histidine kinase [Mediterraneibacter sp.]
MYVIVGILVGVIIVLVCILVSYMRQIKDICRQLRFLKEHESNMLITKEIKLGKIKELTDLLNEMLKERREEAAQYVKKERMIADTYTNLSHDIRTPLTSMDGYFQLLETCSDEADRKRYIGIIQERIESLKEMLEELFTYTKLKNETYELKKERQNLTQILKETLFSYYDEWAEKGIVPEFELTDEAVMIMGNGQALRRVIQNIMKNGLDHGNKELKIRLEKKGNRAELVFKNKVEHPSEIDLQRVFERFYKADEARSKNSTGLGLSITKGFVLKMGGEIDAQMEGDWFCIHIWFPLYLK